MNLIDRLTFAKKADLIIHPASSVFPPTAYLGEDQISELMSLVKLEVIALGENLVGEPLILGMNLVEVKQKDYLRIA